ncbi:NADP-dependent 3-hydroxy acid dehydrogenase YdfG [Paenibacillus tianmuensis]|uniref:NADP-dependent 3-hydroxy acid dehydrogenase YdfG n=1 Tax=Paenibacillus tianmuensis TaxID=624147 RepID=A0A1G4U0Q5_9BACL|nr:oxidoreductase [Paenibacillus tianmuensis]SCW86409.1 NADP-dependent 3-hydroxy acid dehydrogenase YdfG [Paenibacillus tianmuensis]
MDNAQPVALVTGASSGFGLLTSVALARAGYRTVATMRNPDKCEALQEHAERSGVQELIDIMPLDVTDHEAIGQTVGSIVKTYGRIDVLVNNAGFAVGGYVEDVPMEQWRQQLETNVFGVIAATQAVLPHMRERRSGCIVNVSSVSGRIGFPGYAPYGTSKFAVEGFSESLRLEMKPFGVHVVLIEPGAYKTDIWQKGFASICTSEASPYRHLLEKVLRYSKQAAATAPDAAEVADTIVRVVRSKHPKLRYPLGRGAKLSLGSKGLLPWRWYESIVLRLLNK